MRTLLRILVICLLAPAAVALAQNNPLTTYNKTLYAAVKEDLVRSAEKVPEHDYSFRPTPEVRSYGQIIGHVADTQYMLCSIALREKNPDPQVEKTITSKAGLIEALKKSFAYCDRAYDGMTDATAAQRVKLFGEDAPVLGVLMKNNEHDMEHYGNLVTYMRMKNIVPPSSESQPQPKNK